MRGEPREDLGNLGPEGQGRAIPPEQHLAAFRPPPVPGLLRAQILDGLLPIAFRLGRPVHGGPSDVPWASGSVSALGPSSVSDPALACARARACVCVARAAPRSAA